MLVELLRLASESLEWSKSEHFIFIKYLHFWNWKVNFSNFILCLPFKLNWFGDTSVPLGCIAPQLMRLVYLGCSSIIQNMKSALTFLIYCFIQDFNVQPHAQCTIAIGNSVSPSRFDWCTLYEVDESHDLGLNGYRWGVERIDEFQNKTYDEDSRLFLGCNL